MNIRDWLAHFFRRSPPDQEDKVTTEARLRALELRLDREAKHYRDRLQDRKS